MQSSNAPKFRRSRGSVPMAAAVAAGVFLPFWTDTTLIAGTVTIQSGSFVEIGVSSASGGSDVARLQHGTFPNPSATSLVSTTYTTITFPVPAPKTISASASYIFGLSSIWVSVASVLAPTHPMDIGNNSASAVGSVTFVPAGDCVAAISGSMFRPNFNETDPAADTFESSYAITLIDVTASDDQDWVILYEHVADNTDAAVGILIPIVAGRTYRWEYTLVISMSGGMMPSYTAQAVWDVAFLSGGSTPVPLPTAWMGGLGALAWLGLRRGRGRWI